MIYAIDIHCVFSVIPYTYFFNPIPELHPSGFALGYIISSQHLTEEVSSGHWLLEVSSALLLQVRILSCFRE